MLQRYLLGITASIVLAVFIAITAYLAVTNNSLAVLAVLYAPMLGIILLPTLFGSWIYYMFRERGRVPIEAHLLILGPPFSALLVFPLTFMVENYRHGRLFSSAHTMEEVHVNLTGQPLWLGPTAGLNGSTSNDALMPLKGSPVAQARQITRYPPHDDPDATYPYSGRDLKPDRRQIGRAVGTTRPESSVVPLHARSAASLPSDLPFQYIYYHYTDRVEAVPAIARSHDLTLQREVSLPQGLVLVSVANHGTLPIVRLEVDGQALDRGLWQNAALKGSAGCPNLREPQAPALLEDAATLTLRWQLSDAPGVWHEARIPNPRIQPTKDQKRRARAVQLMLYFSDNHPPAAQRFQEVPMGDEKMGILASPDPTNAAAISPCTSVLNGYSRSDVQRL